MTMASEHITDTWAAKSVPCVVRRGNVEEVDSIPSNGVTLLAVYLDGYRGRPDSDSVIVEAEPHKLKQFHDVDSLHIPHIEIGEAR